MFYQRYHAGVLAYVVYAVLQTTTLHPETSYAVYDSDNWSKARWFLLKRQGHAVQEPINPISAAEFAVNGSKPISDSPAGPRRWRLSQDTFGEQNVVSHG